MFKASFASLALVLAIMLPATALAGGTVTKILRPTIHVFDEHGQPAGTLDASAVKVPAPIVAMGMGGSVGINQGGKVVFLRGLDVQTAGVTASCKPVQTAARAQGSSYAATNMGLGGAADCKAQ
ncbi:MAG TPA: hypothetical protein VN694_08475 [Caulobacteraceae bacterium]|nr:hypothetical protein [Caulobacteraceae bacterium]